MKVIIVGCGRVGAYTAASLARHGHDVVVIDKDANSFRLLPQGFKGRTLVGYAFERSVLEEAGIKEADALVSATSGDNTNAVAARIAKEVYRVPDVVSRIYDPQRAEIYRRFGIQTFAPTAWMWSSGSNCVPDTGMKPRPMRTMSATWISPGTLRSWTDLPTRC